MKRHWRIIAPILVVGSLFLVFLEFALVYNSTFGERDSYRVFTGVIDAFQTGKPLSSVLVYGYGISRGYFAFVELFRSNVGDPAAIAHALNLVTAVSAIAAAIPVYVIGARLGGPWSGIAANLALIVVPIWFYGSQYAHPMWPSIAFFLAALMAISLAWDRRGGARTAWLAAAILFLGVAFSIRLDVVLMAPMFLMLALDENRLCLRRTGVLLLIGVAGLALAFIAFALLPQPVPSDASPLELLLDWHNPHRFVSQFAIAQLRLVRAIGPALLIAYALSVLVLAASRNYATLLVSLPTVILNYVFWVPNAQPERHFLYLVPAMALAIGSALATVSFAERARSSLPDTVRPTLLLVPLILLAYIAIPVPSVVYLASVPVLVVLACGVHERFSMGRRSLIGFGAVAAVIAVAVIAAPAKLLFKNPYGPDEPIALSTLAQPLLALPPQDRPIAVISDAYPVLAEILAGKQSELVWSVDVPWVKARYNGNDFLFFIQGWLEPQAVAAVETLAASGPVLVAIDRLAAPDASAQLNGKPNIQEILTP